MGVFFYRFVTQLFLNACSSPYIMISSKESSVQGSVDYIAKAKSLAAEMTIEEKT